MDWLAGYKSPQPALAERLPLQAVLGLSNQITPREQAFHLPAKIACHMVAIGYMPHWDAAARVADIIAERSRAQQADHKTKGGSELGLFSSS